MDNDTKNLDLIATLHYVMAGLTALISLIPIMHVIIGILALTNPSAFESDPDFNPALFGWIFVGVGIFAISLGLVISFLIFYTAKSIRKRKNLVFCQVIAAIECLNIPLGTALGVFTLITLGKPGIAEEFRKNRSS